MADIHDDRIVEVGVPGWIAPAIVILALVAIAGLGLAWYDSSQLQAAQQSFSNEMKAAQQNTAQQIATLEQKETQAARGRRQVVSNWRHVSSSFWPKFRK